MALADIRSAIQVAMQSVTGIGVVTDYEPHVTREEDLKTFFQVADSTQLLGWTITRESTEERDDTTGSNRARHLMVIRGYAAAANHAATEKTFQDLIEAVRTRLRQEQSAGLGGLVTFAGPPSMRLCEPRMFASFLVHYCELTFPCEEFVTVP